MSILGLSKSLKATIVVFVLLAAPLARVALAKDGHGKGGNQRSNSHQQQVSRTQARAKAPSSSRPAAVTRREPSRAVSAPSRSSISGSIQRKPQVSQRITASPGIKKPAVSKPLVQTNKPSLATRFNSIGSRISVTKPSSETGRNQRVFRISKKPSGVEVRRPVTVNPSVQQQRKKPNVVGTSKPKPDLRTRISTPIGRRINTAVETKPIVREKPKPVQTWRVITRIEKPNPVSKPIRQRGHDSGITNSGRIFPTAKPLKKPSVPLVSQPDNSTRPQGTNERTNGPQRFGRGRQDGDSRHSRDNTNRGIDFVRSNRRTVSIGSGDHDFRRYKPASTRRVAYEDRIRTFSHRHHHNFTFRDRQHGLISRIIWPRYRYPVYYRWGNRYSFHYVYPFYQRRYIFVSLGGFWPDYTCIRYYWYPVHSFWWYGYAPLAYEVPGDTYNYYTYNYYTGQPASDTVYTTEQTGLTPVDADTFADVREKLNQEQQGPDSQTVTDALFDEGVKAFEQARYNEAVDKFAAAMALAPDDEILPFAYAQALFADGRYSRSADILRGALQKVTPEKEGVYYPRGLYLDENTLDEQIDQLAEVVESQPYESDLQLLLGYHWLGVGETEKAIEPLTKAKEDYKNFGAASVLLDLAEKIEAGETQ